jgi:type I restriction enzyme S subunit
LDELSSHITSGSRDWTKFYRKDGPCTFIMAQNVRPMKFDSTYRQGVAPPAGDRDRVRTKTIIDDILVTIVGANTGDSCRVSRSLKEYYVCQSVALVRPALPGISRFLEIFLNSQAHGVTQFREFMYGQGRPHLSFDQIRSTAIFLPPLAELEEIVRRVGALLAIADRLEARYEKARVQVDKLTQSTLSKAFRGELVPTEAALAKAEGRDYETAEQLLARIRGDDTVSSRTALKRGRKAQVSAGSPTTSKRQPSASSQARGSTRSSTK